MKESEKSKMSNVRVWPCLGKAPAYTPRRRGVLIRWCARCAEQEADAWAAKRRTNSSVSRESTRTTTRQCNDQDAKAAPCMCLMHADGDKQRGSTNFWSFVVLQHFLYQTVWFAASLSLMEQKCCSVSVGVRGCVACANIAKLAQCLPCARSQTSVQRLLKTKRPANRVLGVSRGVKLLTSFRLKEATVARASAQVDGVHFVCLLLEGAGNEVHSPFCTRLVLVLAFIPTALAAAPAMARVHTIRPGCAPAVYFRRGIHGRTPTCTLGKNWISSRPASNRTALPSRQC